MRNPRTIILAVVSAKNDYANQIILDHCRKIDGQGRRTIGIITKPDFLREGTDNELAWIELALNKDIYVERGWHMLKTVVTIRWVSPSSSVMRTRTCSLAKVVMLIYPGFPIYALHARLS
jgi:hypothetical protein